MDNVVTLNGKIVYVVYRNEETLYTVFRFQINDKNEKVITATGIVPEFEEDVLINLLGTYSEHPRYGMQFNIHGIERCYPEQAEGIIRYLSGVNFPGIGKKTAEKIVATLGEGCLKEIKEDINILYTVPGLKEEKIRIIEDGLRQEDDGMTELVRFLNVNGIGVRNLVRLNKAYGKDALSKLKENPYRVIEECDGFGFKTADKIALSLGFSQNDKRRLYAYLISLCMDMCMMSGDSYVLQDDLREAFLRKTRDLCEDYDELLHKALLSGKLVEQDDRIYPISQYESENYISSFLAGFPYEELDQVDDLILEEYLVNVQKEIQITYDETQKSAIREFFRKPFLIITGGPGTGKTTVVMGLVKLFKLLYPSSTIVEAAPTGRASKRMAEMTDVNAITIHSLLKWDLETNTFGMNEENPILADLLIIDEFSMVDNWLFYNLLLASGKIKKICIIGDEDQLPSVSPGCVLRDLINTNQFSLVRLSHIYRQKQGSDVIRLASQIREGKSDFTELKNDVRFFECQKQDIKNNIVKIVENAINKGYELNEIQVLSPMYNGTAGIDVLNNALQDAFNPRSKHKKEMKVGYTTFREGDKILQLKNQADDDVFNGDIGILEEIYEANETLNHMACLVVNFDGIIVEYSGDNLNNITLAYCISIHKAQGSEYPIVIMPITSQFRYMLQRKLIYTGITRARQSLILIGEQEAFKKGIEINELHCRNTGLADMIQKKYAFSNDF